ncbi:MAG TPA: CPBP family intramembrane glutamic endopeptidase [Microbacterium sp.]|nr:CPBP family intramembrane glutamic endopeptidase [Microbacterium sp.]
MNRPRSFVVAVTLITWFLSSAVAAVALLIAQPHIGPDPAVLSLVMLAPAIGALPALLVLRRDPRPWRPARVDSGDAVRMLVVVLAVCTTYFIAIAIAGGGGLEVPASVAGIPLVAFIAVQAFGALCEEIGFRGILFHGLLRWMPRWLAALAVGVVFGMWHVQYFGLPFLEHLAFFGAVLLLNATMIFTMVGSFWWRMLTCTLIHLCANLALTFSSSGAPSMTVFVIATAAGAVVAAVLVPLLGPRANVQAVVS